MMSTHVRNQTDKFSFYESRSSNKIQSEFANREKDSIKQLK